MTCPFALPARIGNVERKTKWGGSLELPFEVYDANGYMLCAFGGPRGKERAAFMAEALNAHGRVGLEDEPQ